MKYHLFGDLIEKWIKDVCSKSEILDITMFQPDSGLTNLNNYFYSETNSSEFENLLVICGNEIGDIIYESVMKVVDSKAKLYLFSKNYYLSYPYIEQVPEYQTVHGSADNLLENNNKDKILPYATLNIAADICEKILGIKGITQITDEATILTRRKKLEITSQILKDFYTHLKI